jgi:hypothetical protein
MDTLVANPLDTTLQYQWYKDNELIRDETTPKLSIERNTANNADYTVAVLSGNACVSDVSLPYSYVSIKENISSVSISPNPAKNHITLNGLGSLMQYGGNQKYNFEILDMNGKVLQATTEIVSNDMPGLMLNISKLVSDSYILKVSNDKNIFTFAFVVAQ